MAKVKAMKRPGAARQLCHVRLRPEVVEALRELAEVRSVPMNLIIQVSIDRYLASLVDGEIGGASGGDADPVPSGLRLLADASLERERRRVMEGRR